MLNAKPVVKVTPPIGLTPRRHTVGLLLAGRAAFRGLWLAAPLLLAGTWTAAELGSTLAAIGGFGWVTLMLGGTEKATLRLVPRMPRLSGQVARLAFGATVLPLAAAMTAAVLATVAGSHLAVWLWGLSWAVLGGWLQQIAAAQRLEGRAWADTAMFGAGGAWILAVTGATVLTGLAPLTWLIGCQAGLLAVSLVGLYWGRGLLTRPGPTRPLLVRPVLRGMALLGLPEVLSNASLSAGYWAITLLGSPHDVAPYYFSLVTAGVFGSVIAYVARVHQPGISLRQRGAGAAAGEHRARLLARYAVSIGLSTLGVSVVAWRTGAGVPVLLGLLVIGEILVFGLRTVCANLVENSRSRWLPGNVLASASGLVLAAVVLLLGTASLGPVAAMSALLISQITNAAVLWWLLRSSGSALVGRTSTTRESA